ncbi:hypothetical protein [Leptospira idonii]|uniref:hypothetical protein n=1 Tax=Leptospira idonii TaxID=1193500 RepID=UPI0014383ECB|nr:hypothetical protein [Leptospira idonii]
MLTNEQWKEREWVESVLLALMEETVLYGTHPEKSLTHYSDKIVKHFQEVGE